MFRLHSVTTVFRLLWLLVLAAALEPSCNELDSVEPACIRAASPSPQDDALVQFSEARILKSPDSKTSASINSLQTFVLSLVAKSQGKDAEISRKALHVLKALRNEEEDDDDDDDMEEDQDEDDDDDETISMLDGKRDEWVCQNDREIEYCEVHTKANPRACEDESIMLDCMSHCGVCELGLLQGISKDWSCHDSKDKTHCLDNSGKCRTDETTMSDCLDTCGICNLMNSPSDLKGHATDGIPDVKGHVLVQIDKDISKKVILDDEDDDAMDMGGSQFVQLGGKVSKTVLVDPDDDDGFPFVQDTIKGTQFVQRDTEVSKGTISDDEDGVQLRKAKRGPAPDGIPDILGSML